MKGEAYPRFHLEVTNVTTQKVCGNRARILISFRIHMDREPHQTARGPLDTLYVQIMALSLRETRCIQSPE